MPRQLHKKTNKNFFDEALVDDLTKVTMSVYKDLHSPGRLKTNIPKVRTIREVADDMRELYHHLLI